MNDGQFMQLLREIADNKFNDLVFLANAWWLNVEDIYEDLLCSYCQYFLVIRGMVDKYLNNQKQNEVMAFVSSLIS